MCRLYGRAAVGLGVVYAAYIWTIAALDMYIYVLTRTCVISYHVI